MDYIQTIIDKLPANAKAKEPDDLDFYGFNEGLRSNGMGTTHLSVITPNMSVAVTATINDFFGSGFLSPSTGVLLNNDMDCFSFRDNRFQYNKVEPRKRPLSSGCPTVVIDSNRTFKLVTGAAGGKRIPPAVGQVSEAKGVGWI